MKMKLQLTVPEHKNYTWETCQSVMPLKQALKIGKSLNHKVRDEVCLLIHEVHAMGKHLTGPRLKELLILAAQRTGWHQHLPGAAPLKRKYPFLTGDPATRRCVKCGTIKPLFQFMGTPSFKQSALWGHDRMQEMRPTKRQPRACIKFKCRTCRNIVVAKRRKSERYTTLRLQLKREKTRLRTLTHQVKREKALDADNTLNALHYLGLRRGMLEKATYASRMQRVVGRKPPRYWQFLLTEAQRSELQSAYYAVVWHQAARPCFEEVHQ
jgi:hypothetical protein